MIKVLLQVWKSFGFAVSGMKKTFKSERMFRFYIFLYTLMSGVSLIIKLPFIQYLLLMLSWSAVLSFELINTAVEKTVDALKMHNKLTEYAKDAAAGSVALMGVTSGIITIATWTMHLM